ncbi:DinB superfamily protein [Salegentibacter echinorum]|uniref:DinB superfamily protein n=2 Tax=Salegentibacter echinorum TaxID=1073325 RepID=A0A1M5CQ06_SALEC|nr:DinB superfamily protein [Salegentibacter echinorum]
MVILMPVETQHNMTANNLTSAEYKEFYGRYIKKIPGNLRLGILLEENRDEFLKFLERIAPENLDYAYAQGKWSIAEVLQHIIDVERIFQYRALCIAREPGIVLPGYDHEAYASTSKANRRTLHSLKDEFTAVRNSGIVMYESFSNEMLLNLGSVSGGNTSCRATGFIVAGHTLHHMEIIKEYYL